MGARRGATGAGVVKASTVLLAVLVMLGCAACSGQAGADDDGRHFLWEVSGKTNRVYLLGSVHMLRKHDYPLPAAMEAAYDDAERLLMELDMDDLDPVALQALMTRLGTIADGGRLRDLMGETDWRRAATDARAIGLDLATLDAVEPWLAAMTVVNMEMARQGFRAEDGIEMHFTRRAGADGKPIEGLETIAEQFGLFDALPLSVQKRFLLKSLDDAAAMANEAETLIDAWKRADLAAMQAEMADGFEGLPALYDVLVAKRNRAWVVTLESLLDEKDDYLVIVGALHLVGEDSVVRLLRERGLTVRQH